MPVPDHISGHSFGAIVSIPSCAARSFCDYRGLRAAGATEVRSRGGTFATRPSPSGGGEGSDG
jgi:hypothetical protein